MAQPYIGELRMFAGNFPPNGWMFCEGQLLPIAENDVLFTLIGTTYGGDGETTFGLPDLRGRIPVHQGTGPGGTSYIMGQTGGTETVTLTSQQIPSHSHPLLASTVSGNQISPQNHVPANSPNIAYYINDPPDGNMSASAIGQVGGSQPHNNVQPFLCINFIISLFGIFPSQT